MALLTNQNGIYQVIGDNMPTLVQLGFIHYAPKDSEEGIKEYLIVDSMEQIVPYMIKEYGYGYFDDIEEDEDEGCA